MPRRRAPRTGTTLVEAKPWQESRTIWLAILSVVVPILTYAADNALSLGLPDKAIPWIALFIFAIGTIRQRFETVQPIGQPGELIPVDGAMIEPPKHELTRDEMLAMATMLRDLAKDQPGDREPQPDHVPFTGG